MVQLKKNGFGLIEVLIASGLMAVVGIALSQIVVSGSKGQSNVQAQADMTNLQTLIRMATSSAANCDYNFGPPNPTPDTNTFNPTTLPVSFPLNTGIFYPSGTKVIGPASAHPIWGNGLTITNLSLYVTQSMGSGNYIGSIHVEATKGTSTVLGSGNFSVDVPLILGTTGAAPAVTIISCSSQALAQTACPDSVNWVQVNAGTNEAYCISKAPQPAATVPAAMQACNSAATPTHMCTANEWSIACQTGAFTPGAAEWSSSPMQYDNGGGGHTGLLMGPGGTGTSVCFQMRYWNVNGFADTNPYRCCTR